MTRASTADPTERLGRVELEPVEGVSVLPVCDNTIDIFLLDEGPAHRILGRGGAPPMVDARTMRGRQLIDAPEA